jgi:transposase InsO family protein
MPWKEIKPMDQKVQLIADWCSTNFSKTDLSKKYNVSRKTIHKWILRYKKHGIDGLKELSKEPLCKPNATKSNIIKKIIDYKIEHSKRGPKKIFNILSREYPKINWPCPSTIGYWLKKNNLVNDRRRIKRVPSYNNHFTDCLEPNDVWSIDYKGQFFTQDKKVCYPLTITDNFSRYLFKCQSLSGPRYNETRNILEKVFREYGLPKAIRSDNGTPFASKSIAGLSRLSIWFIQQGIVPERIQKGCPQQNGRHERMHKTLKYEALDPIAKNMKEQQKIFDKFQIEYNFFRPHEALDQKFPSEIYKKSSRRYIERITKPIYDYDYKVRQVRNSGEIQFNGKYYFLTNLLDDKPVGLKQIDEETWNIYYYFFHIGSLNLRKNKIFSK